MASALSKLFGALELPFDARAHAHVPVSTVPPMVKHATEDLSRSLSNFEDIKASLAPHPCLREMLTDTRRRVFDDCGTGDDDRRVVLADGGADPTAPCACSWRTPILDANGSRLDDAALRHRVAGAADGGGGGGRSPAGQDAAREDAPSAGGDVALVVTWSQVRSAADTAVAAVALLAFAMLWRWRRKNE